MNERILASSGARFSRTTVLLGAVLVALATLLAASILAKPSGAQTQTVTVQPSEVGFGAVEVSADPETRTISIKNIGATTLVIGGVDISGTNAGDFSLATTIDPLNGLSVGAGEVVTLDINFDPATEGAKNAILTLNNLLGQAIPGAPQINVGGTGVTVAPTAPADCDIVGTNNGETLTGTPNPDVICGLRGNDKINGLGANDLMRGGAGKDLIKDKSGKDKLLGQRGRDTLNAKDGDRGDLLKGGRGKDRAVKDKKDKARGI